MRAIWSGSIAFGLITIPVRLYTAVGRRESIDLHMLHDKDNEPIHYKRVCEAGHEVDWDEIIKGYEYSDGRWVTFTDEELEALDTRSAKTVDVVTFVAAEQIDPMYFDRTYYVEPEDSALKAYRLLADAVDSENLVGVSKVAIRQREHLAAIRVLDGLLVLHTMHWPDEIREPAFDVLDRRAELRDQEKKMARQLVQQLSDDFDPDRFQDEYYLALKELARRKVEGEEIVVEAERPQEEAGVVDLMEALRQSVDAARRGEKPQRTGEGRGGERRRVPSETEMREWTKDELYQRAKELDVPGRSNMDKSELIRAISRAA